MEERVVDHTSVKKYLLGDLVGYEQERIEQRLLTDKEFIEQVSIAQTELVDEYVTGDLTAGERESFEKHFLSTPSRFQKLQIAKALDKLLEARSQDPAAGTPGVPGLHRPRHLKIILSAAAGVALLLSGYIVWERIKHKRSDDQVIEAEKRRAILANELLTLNHQPSTPAGMAVLSLALKPILVRDIGENRTVVISRNPSIVELQLELQADRHQSYQTSLQTDEGVELGTVVDLEASLLNNGKVVILRLPTWLIRPGGYQIKLRGVAMADQLDDVGLYPFQIISK